MAADRTCGLADALIKVADGFSSVSLPFKVATRNCRRTSNENPRLTSVDSAERPNNCYLRIEQLRIEYRWGPCEKIETAGNFIASTKAKRKPLAGEGPVLKGCQLLAADTRYDRSCTRWGTNCTTNFGPRAFTDSFQSARATGAVQLVVGAPTLRRELRINKR